MGSGSTPRSRRTRSTPSIGPATARSRSSVEPDRIVIRRAGEDGSADDGDSGSNDLDPDEFAA